MTFSVNSPESINGIMTWLPPDSLAAVPVPRPITVMGDALASVSDDDVATF